MIIEINCTTCGAPTDFIVENVNSCSFCGTELELNYDIVSQKVKFRGNSKFRAEFNNLIIQSITSYRSGDNEKTIQYLSQSIELDPLNSDLWEFYLQIYIVSLTTKIKNSDYLEISRIWEGYKKSSKSDERNENVKRMIIEFYKLYKDKYDKLEYDKSLSGKIWDTYSDESISILIGFINTSILCYSLTDDLKYLRIIILELSGHNKHHWLVNQNGEIVNEVFCLKYKFDPLQIRHKMINTVREKDDTYDPPDIIYKINNVLSYNNGNCFVATICYGDFNDPDVIFLRKYRDQVLREYLIGQIFILFYYKISPYVCTYIEKREWMKKYIKLNIIENIVSYLKKDNIEDFTRTE